MKHFTKYPCHGCGLLVSNAGVAHGVHMKSAKHQLGISRNVLRKLVEEVPHGCMHVSAYLIEAAQEAIADAEAILEQEAGK